MKDCKIKNIRGFWAKKTQVVINDELYTIFFVIFFQIILGFRRVACYYQQQQQPKMLKFYSNMRF